MKVVFMDASSGTRRDSFDAPALYRIGIQGDLDNSFSDRLGGMLIVTSSTLRKTSRTMLFGRLMDQGELIGVLYSLYDMHMTLLSLEMIEGEDGGSYQGGRT